MATTFRGINDVKHSAVPTADHLIVQTFSFKLTSKKDIVIGPGGKAVTRIYFDPGSEVSVEATMRTGFALPKIGDLFEYDANEDGTVEKYEVDDCEKKGQLEKVTQITLK